MSMLQKVLAADSAGPAVHRLYEHSGKALAGLVPLAILSPQDSSVAMVTDLALVPVITLHSHVSMNCVISDYVPRSVRGLSRWGMLGVSAAAAIGLTRLAVSGPGIAGSVKRLWD
ncbi:hypothetical protein BSKO_03388 [Bryopsis sp. KO-2023]|nr:hypothetical protein BSKO_03388 [Bryopsis sp. KO-2023]